MILISPWWLCLLILAVVPWFGPWKGQNTLQNFIRSSLFFALAIALAQPKWVANENEVTQVVVWDQSASVAADSLVATESITAWLESADSHLVVVGGEDVEPEFAANFQSVKVIAATEISGDSPLPQGLGTAQQLIAADRAGSVLVVSDGLATCPDDYRDASALRNRDIHVDWLCLGDGQQGAFPVSLTWDGPLRVGSEANLVAEVAVDSQVSSGIVEILQDGVVLCEGAFSSSASSPTIQVPLEFEPSVSGFLDVDVAVRTDDGRDTDSLRITLPIDEPFKLLYLGSRQGGATEKIASMVGSGFEVANGSTENLSLQLQESDLVMMDDLSAADFPQELEEQIVAAVENQGLGLVMSGGRGSFGAGGWHDRPVESLLPIEFVQKEEKRDPSTSLVVVIDTSGSMTGVRVQLAKEVARLAMRRLLPHDKVGIVEFYGAKRWAAPLQPASNAIELQRALNRMDAGGGTVILPALEEAFYGLQNVDTRYKHVLVLTDGGVESGDFESLLRRMSNEGINVSTVLTGGGYHSEFLVNIANWGKGRFYNVPNRFNLPEILLKQPSTTKLPSYRPGVHNIQARGGAGWWGEVDVTELPELAGYVEGKARPGAEVLLETSNEKHPVLASWRYGAGRVTALGTEPLGEGTEPWNDWDDYGKVLTRVLQRTAADAKDPFRFYVSHDGTEVQIHAIRQLARDAKDLGNAPRPILRLTDSESEADPPKFVSRTPDHYVAFCQSPLVGDTLLLEASTTSTPYRWQRIAVPAAAVKESHVSPMKAKEFEEMIGTLGGKVFSPDDSVEVALPEAKGKKLVELSPWLFGVALLLFLAELIVRRLPRGARRSYPSQQDKSGSSGSASATAAGLVFALAITSHSTVAAQNFVDNDSQSSGTQPEERLEANPIELRTWVKQQAAGANGNGLEKAFATKVFDRAVLEEGTVAPIIEWLDSERHDESSDSSQFLAELEVALSSKLGDLERASQILGELLESSEVADKRLDLLLWHAKIEDALGNVENAKDLYESLSEKELPESDQQTVRLRLALMDLIGTGAIPGARASSNNAKPLIELAQKSDDVGFKNRAANVLAVQNKHADAIKLFTVQGEGTGRFRSASRVTEWAIRAKDRKKAIETAWIATDSAQLKRDRNYALALLVESYRMKEKKKGLEALVKEFTERNEAEGTDEAKGLVTAEMRNVWISLLRELGQYDEAIKLFKATQSDAKGFTVEMRRELLEMEGEAGYEARMLDSYRELIESEPDELVWRSGLTQLLLEKGKDTEARELWAQFVMDSEKPSVLLQSAQSLGEFGLDDLAKQTIERMVELEAYHGQALLYWADLQSRRGNVEAAESTLNRLQKIDTVGDDVRSELASAFERIGRQDKAIEVNELIRNSRERVAEDLEMRLAWLYSEVGDEEKALEQWLALWRKVTSVPRRRYVEERLMTVASRLGTLADIAIELEEKLEDGSADDREAGLLVRIYSRVNDAVAATEISEEYMSRSGKNEVDQLQEKGRIYQICNDYWNYEKVVERLIEVDPQGKTEYLRQLALSMLERGKAQEARKVLLTLRGADDGKDSIGGEFEAGVLALVGMNAEAAQAYRKGIATYPDRIESYLLLANLLKDMGKTQQAVGMFQYLAETAERDDMFTIAIDGILNMEARGPAMQWARRITLERLAGREDKNYLYQLLSDLSFEVNDKNGQIRALENSLAVSGSRRLSVLRECMELSSRIRGGVYYSGTSRGPTNKGNEPFFAFGRRLIGLGELMPPQVFLDLGQAFLDDGDSKSAERTFGMARNLADPRSYQREVAMIFEKATKLPEALVRFDKLLRTSPSDVALIARVAKLNEQEGKDEVANRFYQRGLNLLLSQTPLTTQEEKAGNVNTFWSSNRDAYQTYSDELLQGLLVTLDEDSSSKLLDSQFAMLKHSFESLREAAESGREASKLSDAPRIQKRSELMRRMYFAFSDMTGLEKMDALLTSSFPEDENLLVSFARERINKGRYDSVRRTVDTLPKDAPKRDELLTLLGEHQEENSTAKLAPVTMWQRLLPVWMNGDDNAALKILRRVDQNRGQAPNARATYIIVNGMAVLQSVSGANDVTAWMRLAIELGDEGLALQLARKQVQKGGRYDGPNFRKQMETFQEILPQDAFRDLVRFAANVVQEDENRIGDYLWLLSKNQDELNDLQPDDDKLLELIEDGELEIGYYFPFPLAMEVFPESIRAEALSSVLDSMVPMYRPRELIQVPFGTKEKIAEGTAEVLLDSLESGIEAAMQDDYLRYCTYSMPRNGQAVANPDNVEFALKSLDLFMSEEVRRQEKIVPRVAEFVKAVVLHQAGETDKALEIVLKSYDPSENITDYYLRNSRDYAYRELVPAAPERFLAKLDESTDGSKPSEKITDQKIALARQCGDNEVLRAAYRQAIKDHPQQLRYFSTYERWEQGQRRTASVIKLFENQIFSAREAEKNASTKEEETKAKSLVARIPGWETRLASLWQSVQHPVNNFRYWSIADDRDIAKFEKERLTHIKKMQRPPRPDRYKPKKPTNVKVANATKPESGTTNNNKQTKIATVPGLRPSASAMPKVAEKQIRRPPSPNRANSNGATNAVAKATAPPKAGAKKDKTYPANMTGVKNALDDKNEDAAKLTLRGIWRTFPPVTPSPYGYRVVGNKRVNGLTWPATRPAAQKPSKKEESDEEKKKAEEARKKAAADARARARGGLGVFKPTPPRTRKKPENAWLKLAEKPFASDEMKKILRIQTANNISNVKDVSLALLQADCADRGEDEVFNSILERINSGYINDEVLVHFFAMLEKDESRLKPEHSSLVDVLMQRLDLTNANRAMQLADICSQLGQKKRAKALFKHCALLGASGTGSLNGLLAKAKEAFEGEELMDLAELMFGVTKKTPQDWQAMIKLRSDEFGPKIAAERSMGVVDLFAGNRPEVVALAINAAVMFAKANELEAAAKCLAFVVDKKGEPREYPNDPYRSVVIVSNSTANQIRVARTDLVKMFPEDKEGFEDYSAWLKLAGKTTSGQAENATVDFVTEVLLTISYRQCQQGETSAAQETLSLLPEAAFAESQLHELLAIDVFRLAEQPERALSLEKRAYEGKRLSHLRFGDLLRDTYAVEGADSAASILENLSKLSLDEDLLAAAKEIGEGEEAISKLSEALASSVESAKSEREARQNAAKDRAAERAKWKKELAELAGANVKPATNSQPASAAKAAATTVVPAQVIRSMRVVPLRTAPPVP